MQRSIVRWLPCLTFCLALLVTLPSLADEPDDAGSAADLNHLLEPIRARHDLPALAGAIVTREELTAIGAVGVRCAGSEQRVTTSDAFHIGSCTKAMTATLIGMLVDDGTIAWNTTLGEVFDDVPMHEAWKPVTVQQLLRNRGGAPADLHAGGLWGKLWSFKGSPREARMELVRGVLVQEPGTIGDYVYSNAGFAMAGAMAEQLADASWEELMRKRLFHPLNMTTAGFGPPGASDDDGEPSQPRGHRPDGQCVPPGPWADNPPAIGPAATVHCSLADWGKFISLHLSRNRGGSPLVSEASLAQLHEPADESDHSYAMGWIVTQRPWAEGGEAGRGEVLNHGGSNTMWYAVVWIAPERNVAILVATNRGGAVAAGACDEVVAALLERHLASETQPEH